MARPRSGKPKTGVFVVHRKSSAEEWEVEGSFTEKGAEDFLALVKTRGEVGRMVRARNSLDARSKVEHPAQGWE